MLRAAMPEAAIDENCYFGSGEYKVRLPKQFGASAPTAEGGRSKKRNSSEFGRPVSLRANSRHYL